MSAFVATVVLLAPLVLIAFIIWSDSPARSEDARHRREVNELRMAKLRRELEIDLMVKEWHATASLEDLQRHRWSLERNLEAMGVAVNAELYVRARDQVVEGIIAEGMASKRRENWGTESRSDQI